MAKAKQILGTLVLFFILFGLPAVSYYYLKTGYDYRKEIITSQEDYGPMPDLSALRPVRGTFPAQLRGRMAMVGWLDPAQPAAAEQYGHLLDSLYQQFEDAPNLYFTTLVTGDDPEEAARNFANQHNLPAAPMLSFLAADRATFERSARDFALPQPELVGREPLVALVDSSLTIVQHYNLSERNQTVGLVQLIASIIPLKERPDIVLEREREL